MRKARFDIYGDGMPPQAWVLIKGIPDQTPLLRSLSAANHSIRYTIHALTGTKMLDQFADHPPYNPPPDKTPRPEEQPNPDRFPEPVHDPLPESPHDPIPPQHGDVTTPVHG